MTNVGGMAAMILASGIFAGSAVTGVGSGVADMIRQERRGRAMAVVMLGQFVPILWAPVFGAFVGARWGWRWIFRLSGIMVCHIMFCTSNA
jgi:MFS family permease